MSCSSLNPHLPHTTTQETEAWMASFLNKIDDQCGNNTCDNLCQDLGTPELITQCQACASRQLSQCPSNAISVECQVCLDTAVVDGDQNAFFQCAEGHSGASRVSTGGLIGIVLGIVVGLVAIAVGIYFFVRYERRRERAWSSGEQGANPSYPFELK